MMICSIVFLQKKGHLCIFRRIQRRHLSVDRDFDRREVVLLCHCRSSLLFQYKLTSSGRNKSRSRSKESKEGKDLAQHGVRGLDLWKQVNLSREFLALMTMAFPARKTFAACLLQGAAHVLRSLQRNLKLKLLQVCYGDSKFPCSRTFVVANSYSSDRQTDFTLCSTVENAFCGAPLILNFLATQPSPSSTFFALLRSASIVAAFVVVNSSSQIEGFRLTSSFFLLD